jgi:hypothetical protein
MASFWKQSVLRRIDQEVISDLARPVVVEQPSMPVGIRGMPSVLHTALRTNTEDDDDDNYNVVGYKRRRSPDTMRI